MKKKFICTILLNDLKLNHLKKKKTHLISTIELYLKQCKETSFNFSHSVYRSCHQTKDGRTGHSSNGSPKLCWFALSPRCVAGQPCASSAPAVLFLLFVTWDVLVPFSYFDASSDLGFHLRLTINIRI